MGKPHRVLLVDPEWAHHRLVSATVHERFPEAAIYSAGGSAEALDLVSYTRFELILVEAGVGGGAEAVASALAERASGIPVKVFAIGSSEGAFAAPAQTASIAQLVEQHLKG